jgi:hypothetical protein
MKKGNKSEAAKLRQNEKGTIGKSKEELTAELVIANEEKAERAAELVIANAEKTKRAAELVIANVEKAKRAAEFVIENKELVLAKEKAKLVADLIIVNKELNHQITVRKLAEEELKTKLDELQRIHNLTVGRETAMIELKKEVNELLRQSGQKEKYVIVE